jgi:hypothetical protein
MWFKARTVPADGAGQESRHGIERRQQMIAGIPLVLGAIVALWSMVVVGVIALCRMSAEAEAAGSGVGSEALAAEYVTAPEGPVRHV